MGLRKGFSAVRSSRKCLHGVLLRNSASFHFSGFWGRHSKKFGPFYPQPGRKYPQPGRKYPQPAAILKRITIAKSLPAAFQKIRLIFGVSGYWPLMDRSGQSAAPTSPCQFTHGLTKKAVVFCTYKRLAEF